MKAFVFKENNEFIGRFEIASIAEMDEGFASFVAANPLRPYSYVECDGRAWTVIYNGNECSLVEGRKSASLLNAPVKRLSSNIVVRFLEGYSAANETIRLGNLVKGIGIFVAIIGYVLAFVIARGGMGILASILSSTISGLIIYAFGALLAAQGRILRATLDTAANTSPNLDGEERAHLMSISPED